MAFAAQIRGVTTTPGRLRRSTRGQNGAGGHSCFPAPFTAVPESFLQNSGIMKWTGIYLLGFVVMLGGIIAALWKTGALARIGTAWTVIGVVIALGIGIMIAVANSGRKESIQIEK